MIPINLYINENIDSTTLFTESAIRQYFSDKGYVIADIGSYNFSDIDPKIKQVYTEEYVPFDIPPILLDSVIKLYVIDNHYFVKFHDREQTKLEAVIEEKTSEIANREKRNQLLRETDWIESNPEITEDCKKSYRAYRQLLRDIFQVVDIKKPITFPSMPKLVFDYLPLRRNTYEGDLESRLQNIQVYSNAVSKWNLFLQEWAILDKPSNIAIILKLVTIYCPEMLENVRILLNS